MTIHRLPSRVLLLAGLGLSLTGCLPSHSGMSPAARQNCMAQNARFADAWACIKARLAARDGGVSDPKREGFVEEGDLLAEQVRAGTVSDADARARLRAGLSHEIGL